MRLRTKAWISERIREYAHILVGEPTLYKGRWRELFPQDNPLHVEVGTGKGRFISTLARQNPAVNYIGLEYMRDVLYYAARNVADKQLTNIVLLNVDANYLPDIFRQGEIARIYINFCDPWPKNRHAKRRLTHHGFLARYKQILAPGGEIHFKTDNAQLFAYSLNEFAADREFQLRNITLDLHNSGFAGNVMTEYEEKFHHMGMRIFRCEVKLLKDCETCMKGVHVRSGIF